MGRGNLMLCSPVGLILFLPLLCGFFCLFSQQVGNVFNGSHAERRKSCIFQRLYT